jgi:hypothetical protein
MAKKVILVLVLAALLAAAGWADGLDLLLSIPPIVKLGTVLALDGGLLTNGPADLPTYLQAGTVTLLLGIPPALFLISEINDNPEGVRLWRNVSFFADLGMALFTAGAGIWIIAEDVIHPSGGEDWAPIIGALVISLSIPVGVSALIDTVPLPMETAAKP